MPWPGTDIPAPWDPKPTPAPPDTSQRDTLVKTLTAQHGGQVGSASTPMVKNPQDPSGPEIPGPYDLYTFADGTSVEIAPTGEVSTYTVKTPSGTTGWTDITQVRNPDQTVTFYGKDPKDPGGPLKPVEGLPTSAAPASTTTKPTPTGELDRLDASGKLIPPGDTTTKPISLRDPATGSVIDVPKDPAGSVTAVGDTLYVIKPDGSSTPVIGPDGKPLSKPKDASQFNVPGIGLVNYDPSSGKASVLIGAPTGIQAKDLKPEVREGKTYLPVDGANGIEWQETSLPADKTYTVVQNDPRSSKVLLIDQQGNSMTVDKPDFHAPPSPQAGQALTPDTTAPHIVTIGDNGQPVFTDNPNRLSITDAQKQLIQQLGIKVADGSMSEKAAQDIITNATQSMTSQAQLLSAQAAQQNAQANMLQGGVQAAQAITTAAQQGAQTGAGVLQNRVTAATGALQNLVGQAANAPHLMNVPAGLGDQLVGGLQGWATQLGGGQDVYNSAANLVQRADPQSALGGDAATAYGVLGQMLQKYRDLTGQSHPAESMVAQPQQNAGFTAPLATPQGTLPSIGNNPMLAAQQMYNRNQAGQQLAAATAQAGMPFGAIGAYPMLGAFSAPMTVAPPPATVTV